jgi:uncharacterized protein YutE (UPF0331/DUF86 family)
MIPSHVSRQVIADRLAIIAELLSDIRALPLDDRTAFFQDRRNIWAAESCLRRALEALLDIGRHILAKGYGVVVSEYKEIAAKLREKQALSEAEGSLLFEMAKYRNRMVHFYHEITPDELFNICATQLGDIECIADAYRRWVNEHPELVDTTL